MNEPRPPAHRLPERATAALLGLVALALLGGLGELLVALFVDLPPEPYPGGFPAIRPPSDDPILRYDPHLFWRLEPSADGAPVPHGGRTFRLHTNALGLRDEPFPRFEADEAFQVVAFGDSTTWGDGVEAEQTWPELLEAALSRQRSDRPVEVLNAGMIGYTTVQALRLERRLLRRYDFDLVILANQHIDRAMTSRPDADFLHPRPVELLLGVLHHSGVYRLLRHLIYPPEAEPCWEPDRITNRVPPALFEANMRRMVELARADGAEVLLLLMLPECAPPLCSRFSPKEQMREPEELRALLQGQEQDYRRVMRGLARELSLPLVDIPAQLGEAPDQDSLWIDVIHPSPRGHVLIADALEDPVARLWPPPEAPAR